MAFLHTFTLTQHTPLIHFQHEQDGAFLRMTELKSRLDKYLFNSEIQLKEKKKWHIGKGKGEHCALDYKIRIAPVNTTIQEIEKNPLFFAANMGEEALANPKKLITASGPVKVQVLCFIPELKEVIIKHLGAFFAQTNFGNRSSKGFGSFTVEGTDMLKLLSKTPYMKIDKNDLNALWTTIDYYYKRLKSGINYSHNRRNNTCNGPYHKAYLYTYLNDKKGLSWEKRWLKENFLKVPTRNGTPPSFARALLGLAGNIEFRKTQEPCNPNHSERISLRSNVKIEISDPEGLIERVPSPILFKPVKNRQGGFRIYILTRRDILNTVIEDRAFEFKSHGTKKH